jgi:hypothetical protein
MENKKENIEKSIKHLKNNSENKTNQSFFLPEKMMLNQTISPKTYFSFHHLVAEQLR